MRRLLLAGVAAVGLLGAPAPAHAVDWDEVFGEYEITWESVIRMLLNYFGIYGQAPNSYLGPGGADLDAMWPDDPDFVTVGDAKAYSADRLEDRKGRVQEAMDVANLIVQQQPFDKQELDILRAANISPASLFAAIQIGNEGTFNTVAQLVKMNGLLAELGQNDMDQRVAEDWHRVMAYKWAKYHYQDSAFWTGDRTWEPETIDVGW